MNREEMLSASGDLDRLIEIMGELGISYRDALKSFTKRYLRMIVRKYGNSHYSAAKSIGFHHCAVKRHLRGEIPIFVDFRRDRTKRVGFPRISKYENLL